MSQYCWEGKDTIKLDNRMGENICKSFVQQGTCIPEHKRTPRQIIQIFKWAKVVNRKFSKEDIQMASKHMKRYSTLLVIRKMHIKTIMRNTPTRTAIVRQSDNNKHYQWYRETGISHCCWKCKMVPHFGNSLEIPQNVKKKKVTMWSSNSTLGVTKKLKTYIHRKPCTQMYMAELFHNSQKAEIIQMSINWWMERQSVVYV